MSKRLTAVAVQNAKPGMSRREISDGGSGLYLIVQPSGHKSYATRTRVNGETIKITHGDVVAVSLAQARVLNADAIKEAHQGNDPAKAKRIAKQERFIAAANTFGAVADLCLSDISCVLKFHALRDDEYRLPLVPGMKRVNAKESARERILTDEEIRKVWNTDNAFVRFLLLTAARRNEAAGMRWDELDGADWTLPAARNKTKVDLVRPLSKAAMAVLPKKREGEFVFGNPPDRPLRSYSLLKVHLDKASGVTGWRLHDLRRTARSLMSRAGIPSDHAERCLGHVIPGIRAIYDRHQFHAEKARAFEALARQLALITNPPAKGSNVWHLKRRA